MKTKDKEVSVQNVKEWFGELGPFNDNVHLAEKINLLQESYLALGNFAKICNLVGKRRSSLSKIVATNQPSSNAVEKMEIDEDEFKNNELVKELSKKLKIVISHQPLELQIEAVLLTLDELRENSSLELDAFRNIQEVKHIFQLIKY